MEPDQAYRSVEGLLVATCIQQVKRYGHMIDIEELLGFVGLAFMASWQTYDPAAGTLAAYSKRQLLWLIGAEVRLRQRRRSKVAMEQLGEREMFLESGSTSRFERALESDDSEVRSLARLVRDELPRLTAVKQGGHCTRNELRRRALVALAGERLGWSEEKFHVVLSRLREELA